MKQLISATQLSVLVRKGKVFSLMATCICFGSVFAQSPTPTVLYVTLAPATVTYGNPITADVLVTTSNGSIPTSGSVSCNSGGTSTGSISLASSEATGITISNLPQGSDVISCSYSGSTSYGASSGLATATVNAYVASPACQQAAQNIYNSCNLVATNVWQDCVGKNNGNTSYCPPRVAYVASICRNSVQTMENSCSTMDVFGKFNLLSILYAPPGNKSSVGFTNSQTDGTSTSVQSSFTTTNQQGLSFSVEGFSFGATYTVKTVSTDLSTTQTTIQNQQQSTWPSSEDAIDHTQDILSVWVNPQVEVAHLGVVDPVENPQNLPTASFATQYSGGNWQYDPISGGPIADAPSSAMSVVTVSVADLQNPTKLTPGQLVSQTLDGTVVPGLLALCAKRMPENKCTQAQAVANGCGCQSTDFTALIQQDPFFNPTLIAENGNKTPTLAQVNAADPNQARFVQVLDSSSSPLVLLLDGVNPSTQTSVITDTNNTSHTYTNTVSQTVGATFGYKSPSPSNSGGSDSSPASFGWNGSSSLAWSNQESVGSSTSTVHAQTLILGTTNASCYENIAVYEDTLFHTYVFQSTSDAPNPCP